MEDCYSNHLSTEFQQKSEFHYSFVINTALYSNKSIQLKFFVRSSSAGGSLAQRDTTTSEDIKLDASDSASESSVTQNTTH